MRGPIRSILLAALAVCAFAAITAGQASAATIEDEATALLAIYGNPGSNGAAVPVGGGLGRNFGFGKNMLFQAGNGVGTALDITLNGVVAEAKESYIGGTLMSNKTGENNPLSFAIQFADFQDNFVGGAATPSYADTFDRPWIAEICPPADKACRVEAVVKESPPTVLIEDVSFNFGPGTVVQGDVWAEWENGKEKVAPCIKIVLPPAEAGSSETLAVTQTANATTFPLGTKISAVSGKACLISANNDWYHVGTEVKEPEIKIKNP